MCRPVVWLAPPVSQHPPVSCHCPAVSIACVQLAQHCEGFAFFSGAAEAFTFSHECPLAVEASSVPVTSPSALCVSWCCCDSTFGNMYSRNADLPGFLLQWVTQSSGNTNELVGHAPCYISLYIQHAFKMAKAHEFAPINLWIVTSSEQLVWKLRLAALAFLASFAQDLINLLLLLWILFKNIFWVTY